MPASTIAASHKRPRPASAAMKSALRKSSTSPSARNASSRLAAAKAASDNAESRIITRQIGPSDVRGMMPGRLRPLLSPMKKSSNGVKKMRFASPRRGGRDAPCSIKRARRSDSNASWGKLGFFVPAPISRSASSAENNFTARPVGRPPKKALSCSFLRWLNAILPISKIILYTN